MYIIYKLIRNAICLIKIITFLCALHVFSDNTIKLPTMNSRANAITFSVSREARDELMDKQWASESLKSILLVSNQ